PFFWVEAVRSENKAYEIHVQLDPSVPNAENKHSLKIETQYPRQPIIELPIIGWVTEDLMPNVHRVDFGLPREDQLWRNRPRDGHRPGMLSFWRRDPTSWRV
ncbi:MAG TPA: hypothetical protein VGC99_02385, partial [Candidatus Tectomicrobia bacterium]